MTSTDEKKKAHILIVEDEPDIALGLKADLKNQGYEVETIADGVTAIRRGTAETWDKTAWKTGAFYGNPLTGFTAAQ